MFSVAESGARFSFDEAPVFEDGLPAYGNAFVTQGFIYPYGTLNDSNGVINEYDDKGNLVDVHPEFPEQVIGEWVCRGYFIGNGFRTETGPVVITTQLYDFYAEPGAQVSPVKASGRLNLVTEGYELVDVGVPVERAVTGGTGRFKRARGEAVQVLLGTNASEGVNLRFSIRPR